MRYPYPYFIRKQGFGASVRDKRIAADSSARRYLPHFGISTGESYSYDANGNMTSRTEGGVTYTQNFDAENRLTSVISHQSSVVTSFKYNGDGNLVAKLVGNVATYYIGGVYEVEVTNTTITKKTYYYPAGGAIRVEDFNNSANSGVFYILKDHLGSASVTLDSSGNSIAEARYYPFGETRFSTGTIPTDQRFQGQREVSGLGGLMQFGARFYLPYLNRMVQPDTIVPEPGNPQSLNRYSYVNNTPVNATDPTGHETCYDTGIEIGQGGISQADCWAYGADKWIRGLDVPPPVAGGGYSSPISGGDNPTGVWALVNIWLETLDSKAGNLGKELVDFFTELDQCARAPKMGPVGDCARSGHRIRIIVENRGAPMQTDALNLTVAISPEVLLKATQSYEDLLLTAGEFGHEIEHLRQGPLVTGSIYAEVSAYKVQYQLYESMGFDMQGLTAEENDPDLVNSWWGNATPLLWSELIRTPIRNGYPTMPICRILCPGLPYPGIRR
jgi:RHS repeat-associated protein